MMKFYIKNEIDGCVFRDRRNLRRLLQYIKGFTMNLSIISGNLTKDIEIRYINGGTALATTSIASTIKRKNIDETLFIDLVIFGRTAEVANQYLRKGSKVLVEGRLKLDTWTTHNGAKRSKHSILVEKLEMLGDKQTQQQQQSQYQQDNNSGNTMQCANIDEHSNDDEEIPF